jgi:hypothetical protein
MFWRHHQHSFPILAQIARKVCAIPASNTVIERLFSSAKNVVTERRTRLDCERINQLLFLQKNMNTLKQLNYINNRKRTISMSSTTTVASDESICTVPKQSRLDIDDSLSELDSEILLD